MTQAFRQFFFRVFSETYNVAVSFSPRSKNTDKFLTKKDSITAVKIKAADRVRKYLEGTLHADDGLLFCSTCNVVIDHLRKHKIDKRLESSYHTLKAKTSVWKQQTLKTALNCKTAPQVEKVKIGQSWIKACCAANTPLLKSGNKDMTNFRQSKDANGDATQKCLQLRVITFCSKRLSKRNLALIVDELGADEGRHVLWLFSLT